MQDQRLSTPDRCLRRQAITLLGWRRDLGRGRVAQSLDHSPTMAARSIVEVLGRVFLQDPASPLLHRVLPHSLSDAAALPAGVSVVVRGSSRWSLAGVERLAVRERRSGILLTIKIYRDWGGELAPGYHGAGLEVDQDEPAVLTLLQ